MKQIIKHRFYLPTIVYEIMPLVYTIIGVLLIMGVEIITTAVVGWFLLAGGLMIIKLRVQHRFFGD